MGQPLTGIFDPESQPTALFDSEFAPQGLYDREFVESPASTVALDEDYHLKLAAADQQPIVVMVF